MSIRYLPPDVSYCVESLAELNYLSADNAAYYYIFNTNNMGNLFDAFEEEDKKIKYTHDNFKDSWLRQADFFSKHYDNWFYGNGDDIEKAWILLSHEFSVKNRFKESLDCIYSNYVSDQLKIGDPNNVNAMHGFLDTDNSWKGNSTAVKRFISKKSDIDIDLISRIKNRQSYYDRLFTEIMYERSSLMNVDSGYKPSKSIKQKNRKMIKKSVDFLKGIVGFDSASNFVKGNTIYIEGNQYIYGITKNSLYTKGHSAIKISAYDKNDRLFDLCWYVDDTPAADQAAAAIMSIQSGEEQSLLLDIGNKYNISTKYKNASGDVILDNNITITELAKLDDDHLLRKTKGTTEYIKNNKLTQSTFYNMCRDRIIDTSAIINLPYVIQNMNDRKIPT